MRSAYTRPLRVLMVDNDDSFTCIAAVRIPSELEVTARTADGEVMGVRHRTHPIEGVQFHPESVLTPEGPRMLESFLGPRRRSAPAVAAATIGTTVAVAVEAVPFVLLDEQYRIVEVSPAAEATFGPLRGGDVFESFPGSRPLFLPYYEQARRTGEVVEFAQYYGGYVTNLKAVPAGSMLTVYWEQSYMLDVLTLEGLRDSLLTVLDTLQAREDALHRDAVRRSLRVVRGGS